MSEMSGQPENLSQSASEGFDEEEEQTLSMPLFYGDEDIVPSGRERHEKFSINCHTIDGVRSRGPMAASQYAVSAKFSTSNQVMPPPGSHLSPSEYAHS